MSKTKRNVGYVIEMWPNVKASKYLGSDDFRYASVFQTRAAARADKRDACGNGLETIWQVALDYDGRPTNIIKKVR
jgi:hypothetical protein